jgi:two-component system LytT family response regulator
MKALALDDEPMALEVIRSLVAKVPFLELQAYFTDAFQALDFLHREPVELLFIDINMPDISGLELVSSLPTKPLVIFTTAYAEHAVKGFELDAVDYLLKPFSLARFVKACTKARELLQLRTQLPRASAPPDYFFLKSGYEQVKVRYEEILYLEAAGNYVTFVLTNKRLLTRLPIQEALDLLPRGEFTRVHRSFVVANAKIDRVERQRVCIGGIYIPVGTSFLPQMPFSRGGLPSGAASPL